MTGASLGDLGSDSWEVPKINTNVPHPARVYDYFLDGKDNFEADRVAADAAIEAFPKTAESARAARAFLRRVVQFLAAEAGIRQFLDIGTGLPSGENVHQVAQSAAPRARIVYVDNDPIVLLHAQALLTSSPEGAVAYLDADLRDPEKILRDPAVRRLIDFGQPAGLLLVMVLHFIADAEDPWRIVATLRDALAPGSYLVLAHATDESRPALAQAAETVYNRSVSTDIHMRTRAEILRFFDGFELLDPGLVYIPQWRPDSPADVPADPSKFWVLVGVARKP
jgi:SAM-dependent methyltransferase